MSAWEHFKRLPRRRKVCVVLTSPLWLPVAFAAWLMDGDPYGL